MSQSRFLSKEYALPLLKTKLSLQESNIYFNFNSDDMPEWAHISIELVDRIVNVNNYNCHFHNLQVVGLSINTSIHATLFYNGNVERQEVFITPAELNKFWFDSVDKYEELVSYTNSNKFDIASERLNKIKSLEGRIEDLVLEKNDMSDYAAELETEIIRKNNTNNELRISWKTDQDELKKCLKCCIAQDQYTTKLKSKLHQKEVEFENFKTASSVANNCMDYSNEYFDLCKKFSDISNIVNNNSNYVEQQVNIGNKGIRLDCSPSQYSPPHCCSTSDCLTPGKEYNCLSPEVKYNAGPKITDYYTPISNSIQELNYQSHVNSPKKPNISFKITDNANNTYWKR